MVPFSFFLTLIFNRLKVINIRKLLANRRFRARPLDAGPTQEQKRGLDLEEEYAADRARLVMLEAELDITVRWTPDCMEFQTAAGAVQKRRLNQAIDTVERLMVQRFMEQDKLGVASLCKFFFPAMFHHQY
jgi:hypothetical protein